MNINTIYESISGEGGIIRQGTWVTFIRTQGCSLRCSWCDTPQALEHKIPVRPDMDIGEIVQQVETKYVVITGGEPLEQKGIEDLIYLLKLRGCVVQVETAGHMPPVGNYTFANWVVDYKCPSSNMVHRMPDILAFVRNWMGFHHIVKLVVSGQEDLDFAIEIMGQLMRYGYPEAFLVSPLNGQGEGIRSMAESIRRADEALLDRTVFSVQLHKLVHLP